MSEESGLDEARAGHAAICEARAGHAAICDTRRQQPDAKCAEPGPPLVRRGDVLGTIYAELHDLFGELDRRRKFDARVVEAAKDPAAWMLLRQELAS